MQNNNIDFGKARNDLFTCGSCRQSVKNTAEFQGYLLPDCGHAIPLDAPKEAANAIDSFLSAE